MTPLIWIGIGLCILQSALFSGLNLAFFSISKLRLEIESKNQNPQALKVAQLRADSNFLLATILWGNVAVNVLLTLLSKSVMTGVVAFVFSTFLITLAGEIMPQAYFSRHALRMASRLAPMVQFYQLVLYPVAKPTAVFLNRWLGFEAVQFLRERDLSTILTMHMESAETDIEAVEGKGAINFLAIDDLRITEEGEVIDPASIIALPFRDQTPVFPPFAHHGDDPFLKQIHRSGKKWIILTDLQGEPQLTLNSDAFMRAAFFEAATFNPLRHCHRPIIFRNAQCRLGEALPRLKVHPECWGDDVIDEDIMLFWGEQKRIITGSDVLGRLLRGISRQETTLYRKLTHG